MVISFTYGKFHAVACFVTSVYIINLCDQFHMVISFPYGKFHVVACFLTSVYIINNIIRSVSHGYPFHVSRRTSLYLSVCMKSTSVSANTRIINTTSYSERYV